MRTVSRLFDRLPRRSRRPRSLAGQLFAMQVVLVGLVVAACAVFTYLSDRVQAEDDARHRASATASSVADSPSVLGAIGGSNPSAQLQPYAEQVRKDTGVTFVTIMDAEGVRWTHPDTAQIGKPFLGHTEEARGGRAFTEEYEGTLGPSVRAVAPIRADDGGAGTRVVGFVSAGITVDAISEELRRQLTVLLLFAAAALALGGVGTYLVNRRLRRHTRGMNAAELNRMHDYHEAALHAVREGLLMLDGTRRVALINDGARTLLGLRDVEVLGRGADQLGLPRRLAGALLSSEPRVDEVHLTADRVVVVNTSPVAGGERRGTVVTLRDHTEIQALAGELDSARGLAEALRAQAHEAANRLHTVVSLVELGRTEEAVEFATEELELAQELTDQVVAAVSEPVLAALLLGKAAQANEHGVELVLTPDSGVHDGLLPDELPARDLVTVLGNLIDNAVEAAVGSGSARGGASPPRVTVTVRLSAAESDGGPPEFLVRVHDTGPGLPEGSEAVFEHGWSTKTQGGRHGAGRGIGLALVRQAALRHGGSVVAAEGPGGGAEFTVRLPLRNAEAPA
ncbi:sensor histidine kinase [Streptomyces sulphureus]|uniref:sensor histidine kinase n=1 Tax=Streptomyces sulphureus TaxID=47758 RepID=UPI0003701955|nr:sensor histidine kinase [Streptomyces sulphureus]